MDYVAPATLQKFWEDLGRAIGRLPSHSTAILTPPVMHLQTPKDFGRRVIECNEHDMSAQLTTNLEAVTCLGCLRSFIKRQAAPPVIVHLHSAPAEDDYIVECRAAPLTDADVKAAVMDTAKVTCPDCLRTYFSRIKDGLGVLPTIHSRKTLRSSRCGMHVERIADLAYSASVEDVTCAACLQHIRGNLLKRVQELHAKNEKYCGQINKMQEVLDGD